MSLHNRTAQDFVAPHRDALHVAADDLAAAFRIAPDAMWAPANSNERAIDLKDAAKRAFDLAVAIPMLVFCAPLLLALALLVRFDSKGPALFRQTRLGRDGKAFRIFKFRTMRVMEDGATIVQATRNDRRVTQAGKWLRASSLDELPQLLNVISGEMSLIGPRPHAQAHDTYYAAHIANYTVRQSVKPGLTGWAQINGHRGETATVEAMKARVDLDVWYAENANLGLDLQILLRTPLAVFAGRNAH